MNDFYKLEKWILPDTIISSKLAELWDRPIEKITKKAGELKPENVKVTIKTPGCFTFNDGTTQNWKINQLYDTYTQNKVSTYTSFILFNSQNLALSAYAWPLSVLDKNIETCDFYIESPDLSSDPNWQNIKGYSLDFHRLFYSPCGEAPSFELGTETCKPEKDAKVASCAQLQLVMIDINDQQQKLFAEHDGSDFVFHPLQINCPYHFTWMWPTDLVNMIDSVVQLRIRIIVPGSISSPECLYRGQFLVGNICPIK